MASVLAALSGVLACGGGTPAPVVTVTMTAAATPTPSAAGGLPAGVVATVGSGVVTQAQFDSVIRQAKAQSSKAGQQPFPKVGTYAYVNPVVAVVIGYFLGGEALGLRTILGTLLVLVSVVVITTTRSRKPSARLVEAQPVTSD